MIKTYGEKITGSAFPSYKMTAENLDTFESNIRIAIEEFKEMIARSNNAKGEDATPSRFLALDIGPAIRMIHILNGDLGSMRSAAFTYKMAFSSISQMMNNYCNLFNASKPLDPYIKSNSAICNYLEKSVNVLEENSTIFKKFEVEKNLLLNRVDEISNLYYEEFIPLINEFSRVAMENTAIAYDYYSEYASFGADVNSFCGSLTMKGDIEASSQLIKILQASAERTTKFGRDH